MRPEDIHNKRILFSALNWGLGHVMRSIPLIKRLQSANNEIHILCDDTQQLFFERELKNMNYISHKNYPFNFRGKGHFTRDIIRTLPTLIKRVKSEHLEVEKLVSSLQIDLVLSDQRMGFWSKLVPSILISHQLNLPLKGIEKVAQIYYNKLLKNFTFIWIPDLPAPNSLAGKLSQTNKPNAIYIGWLSRFEKIPNQEKIYDFGAIISGPAPYNQQLFEKLRDEWQNLPSKNYIVFNEAKEEQIGNLEIIKDMTSHEMAKKMLQTKTIVSRAGYTTMMDLKQLNLNAVLIPTPGQNEQQYLVEYLDQHPELGILVGDVYGKKTTV